MCVNRIYKNIGVSTGFVGCIEMLKISSLEMSYIYDLNFKTHSSDIEKEFKISKANNYFIFINLDIF